MNSVTKKERIEVRVTPDEKRLLSKAATYERLDVTSFLMRVAIPCARRIVQRSERIQLSERDTMRVLELLENPPEPTEVLLATARAKYTEK